MKLLTDKDLLATYKLAVEMKLSPEFINMLKDEVRRRGLQPPNQLKEGSVAYVVRSQQLVAIE